MSRYPGAAWMPVTGHDGGPMAHPPLGLVLHVAEGNGSLRGYFQRSITPNRKSATWWAGKDGRLEQYLDSATEPWSQADGNATYASVETEGYATELLTPAQITTLAGLYGWGHETHGWPLAAVDTPGQRGLILHSDGGAAWGGHRCPGPIRAAQRTQILDAISPPEPSPCPPDHPVLEDDMRLVNNTKDTSGPAAGWSLAWFDEAAKAYVRVQIGPGALALYQALAIPNAALTNAQYQSITVVK